MRHYSAFAAALGLACVPHHVPRPVSADDPSNASAPESAPRAPSRTLDPAMPSSPPSGASATPASTPPKAPADAATYSCPMHPDVTLDHPGHCPKCGMTLVRKAPPAVTP